MKTFTLPAEKLPSKAFSLTFREPTFRDRREVSRRFNANQRLGYSLDELLLADCLVAVNEQEIAQQPQDPMDLLREMPQADEQFALLVFLSMFTLDKEQSEASRQLGLQFKVKLEQQHTIPKLSMPGQTFSVTFRKVLSGDRMRLERKYPGADSDCGYSFDEMLFAASLTAVDGQPIQFPNPKDPVTVLDSWTHIDFQFASNVFLNAISIDRDDAEDAKQLGKSLLSPVTTDSGVSASTTSSPSSSPTTPASGKKAKTPVVAPEA